MRSSILFVSVGSLAVFTAVSAAVSTIASAAPTSPPAASAPAGDPIGRITAAFGAMAIEGPAGKRGGDLQSLLYNEDVISTDGGGVTVLLASRVVLKIDANSSVAISEGTQQTNLLLERGTVQVFVGQRPASAGSVVLRDMGGRVETLDGVFLASYDAASRSSYYACERSRIAVSTSEGGQPITLGADTQATVTNGVLGEAVATDRVAFAARKQSVDRLGQSAVRQTGSDTFRLRSRTLDMEVAISQLSAAGWIDRQALQQLTQQNSVASASGSSSGKSTAAAGESQAISPAAAASSANDPASAAGVTSSAGASVAPSGAASVADGGSPDNGSPGTGSPEAAASADAPSAITMNTAATHIDSSSAGPAAQTSVATPAEITPIELTTPAPVTPTPTVSDVAAATATPASPTKVDLVPQSTDVVVNTPSVDKTPVTKFDSAVPKVDVQMKHDTVPTGSVPAAPQASIASAVIEPTKSRDVTIESIPVASAVPARADLGLNAPSVIVAPAALVQLPREKINPVVRDVAPANAPNAGKIDLFVTSAGKGGGSSRNEVPKADVAVPRADVIVPKADVVIPRDVAPPKADLGIAPVAVAAPKNDLDLGGALRDIKDVAKIDIAPKIDVVPKADIVVPKADVVVVPKADIAPRADVIVPKNDVVVPKIDVVPAAVPKIDIAPPTFVPVKADIGIAPLPAAPVVVPVALDITPRGNVAPPAADVGLKDALKDLKDVVKTDVAKIDAPKAEAPKVEAPKIEVPKVDAPKIDVIPTVRDIKVELPTLDVKPADLPTPKDVGVLPTVPTDTKIDKVDGVKNIVDAVVKKDASSAGSKDTDAKPTK